MRAPDRGALGSIRWGLLLAVVALGLEGGGGPQSWGASLGREVAIAHHLEAGEEPSLSLPQWLAHGRRLFEANWTVQEGGGRPMTKGNGQPLTDPATPLVFPRNFNRVSAPDANSCAGCHNSPVPGGNGDVVANVFVLGQRFDFATFSGEDTAFTRGAVDERGNPCTLQDIGNSRSTPGMFGSGFIEMLARQMTVELQGARDSLAPGGSVLLITKGVGFGRLSRRADGTWDTSGVRGLPAPSLQTSGTEPPSLLVRPFHQAGNVVSLRQFSNNAFNHHHGMQTAERFGRDTDPDGDGFPNELTPGDVTAATIFQAAMAVPGRVIPREVEVENAVLTGEAKFVEIGCGMCHVPNLPLSNGAWVFSEPNPFNPPGNLRPGEGTTVNVDLTSASLPTPRLAIHEGTVWVPAFTDLKLHDVCAGEDDPNIERVDMNESAGSDGFFAGNRRFLTRRLWGAASKPNYFHHGLFTTMREAILAHAGEALPARLAFQALTDDQRDAVIEFLKTLQVLPPGTRDLFVDDAHQPREWPPARFTRVARTTPDRLRLEWAGTSGLYVPARLLQVQSTADLSSPDWEDAAPLGASSLEVLEGQPYRFFRLTPRNPPAR